MTSEVTRKTQTRWRWTAFPKATVKAVAKDKGRGKGKTSKPDTHTTKRVLLVRKERSLHTGPLVTNPPRPNSDRVVRAKVGADAAKEFEYTIDNTVKDATLSSSFCQSHEDGLVMIDSGASVYVCSMWLGIWS